MKYEGIVRIGPTKEKERTTELNELNGKLLFEMARAEKETCEMSWPEALGQVERIAPGLAKEYLRGSVKKLGR